MMTNFICKLFNHWHEGLDKHLIIHSAVGRPNQALQHLVQGCAVVWECHYMAHLCEHIHCS